MKKMENWLLVPAFLLLVSFFFLHRTIDVHIHDTYYVITGSFVAQWAAYWVLLLFLLYKLLRKRHDTVNGKLFRLHVTTTFIPLFFILFLGYITNSKTAQYLDYSNWQQLEPRFQASTAMILTLLFLLSQVTFLLYFIIQLLKKPRLN